MSDQTHNDVPGDSGTDALIDRYLNGKLSVDERVAFEIRLLDEPALLEQVQTIDAMKAALRDQQDALRSTPLPANGARILPFRLWVRQPLSLAASLLVAVLGWQMVRVKAPDPATPVGATPASALAIRSVVQLEYARGSDVARFDGAGPYLIKLDAGIGNEAKSFALTLKDAQQHIVLAQGDLTADAEGWVRVVVPGLAAGSYEASLAWADPNGIAQTRVFPFSLGQ